MSIETKISVRNLSKVFQRRSRNKIIGISSDGALALGYLLKKTLLPDRQHRSPVRGSKKVFYALDEINFDVAAGEVVGIIGRNGAGKTTLLKILARVMDPSAGRITMRGHVVSMLELGIGFAPELTVRENIQIHGRLAGIPPKRISEAEGSILDFAGLTDYKDMTLGSCPSGSSVQLSFAAMVNLNVDIILADEVLAVGDSKFRHACEERVLAAGKSGESVLFVSHDMNAIRRICSRVIWIDRGKIVGDGPTEEVVHAYTSELLAGHLLPPLDGDGIATSCRLLDFRLLDVECSPIGALQITEEGYIDCVFQITRPDVAVTVQIELWQGKKHVLTNTTRHAITAREATAFHAGIKVPQDFLNETPYQARCRLYAQNIINREEAMVIAAQEKLDFTVMNPHPDESVWADWAWGCAGLISPKLSWSVKHEKDMACVTKESI